MSISPLVQRIFSPSGFIFFLLFSFVLYGSLFPMLSWATFSDDDAHIMRIAAEYGWFDVYFQPEIYQQLSVAHYTPVELTIYKFLLSVCGLQPACFLIFQLACFAGISALAAQLCLTITKSPVKAFGVMLFIFSNSAILTLASRFYTTHYLVGGLFALSSFIILLSPRSRNNILFALLTRVAVLLSLLAKEVYIVSAGLICIFSLQQRNRAVFVSSALAVLIYMAMRVGVIGFSSEGRSGNGYLIEVFRLDFSQWAGFAGWYGANKTLILLFALFACIVNVRKFVPNLVVALWFAAPSLAAPHSIVSPEMHGDRVFFAFDCALVLAAMFAIPSKKAAASFSKNLQPFGVMLFSLFLALGVLFLQSFQARALQEKVINSSDYKVTTSLLKLLESSAEPLTAYVPLSYQLGELMSVYRLMSQNELYITQNCIQVTSYPLSGRVALFDDSGSHITMENLQSRCGTMALSPQILQPVAFRSGRLSWNFSVPGNYVAGVLFVDRALAVPLTVFSERLVRPKPGERYQLFAYRDGVWWFSEIKPVLVNQQ